MAPGEFGPVVLSAKLTQSGKTITPRLLDNERLQKLTLPSSPRVGEVTGLAVIGDDRGCLLHFEMQATKGSGRIISLGSMQKVMKESVAAAAQYGIAVPAIHAGRSKPKEPTAGCCPSRAMGS
jgi:ATP-dependent Lon protease